MIILIARDLKGGNEYVKNMSSNRKRPISGNRRSHSLRATRRRWDVNLHTYRVEIDGQICKVRMSARAYRTLNKSLKSN